MWKLLVLFPLVLIHLKEVTSTTCYISEIGRNVRSGLLNKTNVSKNCKEQGKNILPIPLPDAGRINCFKLVGTDPSGNKLDIKGCMPTGYCDVLIRNGTKLGQDGAHLSADTKCYECGEDNCNSGSKFSCSFGLLASVIFFIEIITL